MGTLCRVVRFVLEVRTGSLAGAQRFLHHLSLSLSESDINQNSILAVSRSVA